MENDEDKQKKLNEDVVGFMRKRSETEPRYAARLLAYVDLHRKRSRAAAAKLRSGNGYERKISANRKKAEIKQKEKNAENSEHHAVDDERVSKKSHSVEPSDRCGGRRRRRGRSCSCRGRGRRRRRRRRRRRSCRRRRRSCRRRRRRRRSCRRKRRRSCSRRRRRRRRRSCRRRRRGCR